MNDLSVRRHWEIRNGKVFSADRTIRNADASTFEVLNYLYAKDNFQAYYSFGVIKDADPKSFKVLDSGASFGGSGKFLLDFQSYASDKKNVYHYSYTVGKPSIVRFADPLNFQSLSGRFGQDEKRVFIDHRQIKNAQVKSWTLLQGNYSCDDDFCFYGNKRILGADRFSFMCLPLNFGLWAKDQHYYYFCGERNTEKQYFLEFEESIKSLEKTKQALLNGNL